MNLIKARFLRDREPSGRTYTYITNEIVKVGDLVQLNERGQGVVTGIDVPESEVESFKDKLKVIVCKVKEKDLQPETSNESEGEKLNDKTLL